MTGKRKNIYLIITVLAAAALLTGFSTYGGISERKAANLIETGNQYLSELQYQDAVFSYQDALRIDPQNEMALRNMVDTVLMMADLYIKAESPVTVRNYEQRYAQASETIQISEYGYIAKN